MNYHIVITRTINSYFHNPLGSTELSRYMDIAQSIRPQVFKILVLKVAMCKSRPRFISDKAYTNLQVIVNQQYYPPILNLQIFIL